MKIIAKLCMPLCYLPSGDLVCYKDGYIKVLHDNKFIKNLPIPVSIKERLFGKYKTIVRLFRMGIRAAIALDESHVIYSMGNRIFEIDLKIGKVSDGVVFEKGVRPLIFTEVKNISGFYDGIYFGGYLINSEKCEVSIYRRVDIDRWDIIYTFPSGSINHIHNIVSDPFRDCLWVLTGDFGRSAAIWRVKNNFQIVECIANNDQKYRGCVAFTITEGLLYATDTPFDQNYLYLLRPDLSFKEIAKLDGSCIYGCKCGEDFVFSTTVEPDGRNQNILRLAFSKKIGTGISDYHVHLIVGNLDKGFAEICRSKKDYLPFLFQFGAFKFPIGNNPTNKLFFMPCALKNNDLNLMKITL